MLQQVWRFQNRNLLDFVCLGRVKRDTLTDIGDAFKDAGDSMKEAVGLDDKGVMDEIADFDVRVRNI